MAPYTPTRPSKAIGAWLAVFPRPAARPIAKRFGIPPTTFQSMINRYKQRGSLEKHKSSGRPPRIDSQGEERVVRAIQRNPKASYDVFGEIINASSSTVRRIARKHGLKSFIARKKPFISAVNKQKRVQWAHANVDTDWRRVMFTDEAAFRVGEVGVTRVIRRAGTAYDPRNITVKFRPGAAIHVWGCIMHGHKLPLHRFDLRKARTVNKVRIAADKITSEVYANQMIAGKLSEYVAYARAHGVAPLVVEDGASVHFRGATKAVRDTCDIPNQPHPPSSPDLNPIENCWHRLKVRLRREGRRATSIDELWARLQEEWDALPQEIIDHWIEGMDERRRAVLEVNGCQTRW